MNNGRNTMSEKFKVIIKEDKISLFADEVEALLKNIFSIDNALFTDLTELSDFTYSGLTPEQSEHMQSLDWAEKTKYWDAIIIARMKEKYGLELKSVCISLLDVLEMIEKSKNPTIH